jgi:ElaB/YqjD/DUF883 family membrane-anchored ribosome-binding protein
MASNDQSGTRTAGGRGRAAEVFETARERTQSAYEAARDRASAATRQATEQMNVYPVAAVIGGFALGALVATLLPRTEREDRLLGKTGRRITGAAREAAQKGLDAGRSQIEEIRARAAQKVGEAVGDAVIDAVAGKS